MARRVTIEYRASGTPWIVRVGDEREAYCDKLHVALHAVFSGLGATDYHIALAENAHEASAEIERLRARVSECEHAERVLAAIMACPSGVDTDGPVSALRWVANGIVVWSDRVRFPIGLRPQA